MNERIRQLEDACWEELGEDECYYPVFNTKKFAQLIVKECVAIANRQFSAATGLDDRDCLTAQQMKQHFGVEE
jgi:hypothetical protein